MRTRGRTVAVVACLLACAFVARADDSSEPSAPLLKVTPRRVTPADFVATLRKKHVFRYLVSESESIVVSVQSVEGNRLVGVVFRRESLSPRECVVWYSASITVVNLDEGKGALLRCHDLFGITSDGGTVSAVESWIPFENLFPSRN
jgi:hypothetical protein